MSRQARRMSENRIYHIMFRGNERRKIFLDDEDRIRFVNTFQTKIKASEGNLFAFCLMDNHLHLLVGEGKESIAIIMKRIGVSYVIYFNKKYQRIGHLFQDRFKSETIDNDSYFLEVIRYIHNNPVKADMVSKAADYPWSSYNLYKYDPDGIIYKDFVLKMFSDGNKQAISLFEEFHEQSSDMEFLEYDERSQEERRMTEEKEAKVIINDYLRNINFTQDSFMTNKEIRNELIMLLRDKGGLSIRRIADILEINRGVVQNLVKLKVDTKNNHDLFDTGE